MTQTAPRPFRPGRRRAGSAMLAALGMAAAAAVRAQTWPARPIQLVVPFAPGGAADVLGRLVGERLGRELKQSVVVVNRGGAGTVIGVNSVAKAPADGYTLLLSGDAATINTASGRKLPYDLMKELQPVSLVSAGTQFLIVRKDDRRFGSVSDLVRQAKARPGVLRYGSSGVGSSLHMAGEIVASAAGIDTIHVPYRGVAPAMNDLAGGSIDYMVAGSTSAIPAIEQGQFRALAVTARQRSAQLPDVPTLVELGIDAETSGWYGLFTTAGTPAPIVQQLNVAMQRILSGQDMEDRLRRLGGEPRPTSPEQLAEFMRTEIEKFRAVIRERGITLEE